MNLFASIGIVVGIGLFVAALYGVYYYITVWVPEQKHLEEEIQRLQKMEHDLDSDSDSDLDSESSDSEEEFQDLRHHRMYQQIPPYPVAAPSSSSSPSMPPSQPSQPSQPTQPTQLEVQKPETPKSVIQYTMPKPPDIEEWNDVRWFYTRTLPLELTNLGLRNVVEVELLDAVIPRGDYIIHTSNSTFQVRQPFEASVQTFTTITIPIGDYTASALATTITNLVTAAGLSNFTLTYSSLTKSYTFNDDSVIDVSFNDELGYDLGFGATQNLNIGSVQFPVSAIASYEVTSSNNTFTVAVNSGSEVTYTIATSTYTASTLATAMNTAMSGVPGLTAAYLSDGSPSIAIYHTGNALDVALSLGLQSLLDVSTRTGTVYWNSSTSRHYATGSRADLYGSRYTEIRTEQLNAPHLHHRGVLQAAFISNEITNWRATGADTLRRRRFQMPISLDELTISLKERHPTKSLDNDFYDMELNGLAVAFCIVFRRMRYKNHAQNTLLTNH